MNDNLVRAQADLIAARKEQKQRLRQLAKIRQEVRDLEALAIIGARLVNRLRVRRHRAAAKATTEATN